MIDDYDALMKARGYTKDPRSGPNVRVYYIKSTGSPQYEMGAANSNSMQMVNNENIENYPCCYNTKKQYDIDTEKIISPQYGQVPVQNIISSGSPYKVEKQTETQKTVVKVNPYTEKEKSIPEENVDTEITDAKEFFGKMDIYPRPDIFNENFFDSVSTMEDQNNITEEVSAAEKQAENENAVNQTKLGTEKEKSIAQKNIDTDITDAEEFFSKKDIYPRPDIFNENFFEPVSTMEDQNNITEEVSAAEKQAENENAVNQTKLGTEKEKSIAQKNVDTDITDAEEFFSKKDIYPHPENFNNDPLPTMEDQNNNKSKKLSDISARQETDSNSTINAAVPKQEKIVAPTEAIKSEEKQNIPMIKNFEDTTKPNNFKPEYSKELTEPLCPSTGELIINGTMENFSKNVPIGWTTTTPFAVSIQKSQGRVHSGYASVNLANDAALVQVIQDVKSGCFYELSFFVHGEGSHVGFEVFVIFETDIGDFLGGYLAVRKQDMVDNSRNFAYHKLITSITPNNIKQVRVQFVVSANEGQSMDLDDVTFRVL
ncbi:hypothetical protein EDD70_1974 [Hydrogenoanaerobacterium saccharovorans]|uniref:Carbohydrate binding domain-containing protein n=1 Tax=Hydrogenoanaerobacterium saccharovorans TaxID=474960 RepID=A0A1H7YLZ5_9FIRM|nr:hypothetical protein [Hydrogenoanaerobacterium saccharovorans]RPF49134.1 hypothetical protein EDD70_1974 [Hydrogenoanaerobacterium saccharovorans]SEM47140.1 hypothetical protein SAMN05216180_0121 [Hydrogenoanaerobacterium saccharovorans]